MPVSMKRDDGMCLIDLEGSIAIPSAAELKSLILQGLASGQQLCFNLQSASDLDITALQLLWATEREAGIRGTQIALCGQVPDNILSAALDAGFETFPVGSR